MYLYLNRPKPDLNKLIGIFFDQNRNIIEDGFNHSMRRVDKLYIDSNLENPIRVKGDNIEIISISMTIFIENELKRWITTYCIFEIDGTAMKIKQKIKVNFPLDVSVSDCEVSRVSKTDLVNEYKHRPDIYQKYFASGTP